MRYCPLCGKNYQDEAQICDIDGATLRISGKKDPYLGTLIKGRYQVLSQLGEGGMGTVYLAEQVSVGRKVAIKFLLGNYASDDAFIGRFRREARLAASLNHRHIVTVYDFDQNNDGALFIVMEYLNGQKLSDVIRRDGSLAIARATWLGLQIAEGLNAAHRAGVIHRDIKPDNIMVAGSGASEEIKLMDFGIARLRDTGNASQITRAGLIMGTPAYMAPEQVDGGEVSDKTDIYALGVVLYEMLAGKVPFTASTPGAVLIKQIQEMPLPLRKLRRELPVAVERVVMQALEKEPHKRQQTMEEVVRQLRTAEEQLRGKPTAKSKEPGLGWDRIGQAFRKTDEKKPPLSEPPPPPPPTEFADSRTILDMPGPQWAPTQALSSDDVYAPETRSRRGRKAAFTLGLLGLAGILGSFFYWGADWYLAKQQPEPAKTVAPEPMPVPEAAPEIVSLIINSDKRNLTLKERAVLTANGRFSDGAEEPVTAGLEWRSSDSSVVTVDSAGRVQAQGEGSAEVTAAYKEQVSAPIRLFVKADRPVIPTPAPAPIQAPLRSLIIVAAKRELQANEQAVLSAMGQYADGKESEVRDEITWTSSDPRIATVDSKGRVRAHRSGQVRLSASHEGITSPAISLVVRESRPQPDIAIPAGSPPVSSPPRPPKPETERPKPPDIRENLRTAVIFYEEGKYAEALIELEHALRLAPESKEARSLRIRVQRAWEAEKNLTVRKP